MKKLETTKAHESLDVLCACIYALKAIDSFADCLQTKDQECSITLIRNNSTFVLDTITVDEHLLGFIRIYYEAKYREARSYLCYDMRIPEVNELKDEESS